MTIEPTSRRRAKSQKESSSIRASFNGLGDKESCGFASTSLFIFFVFFCGFPYRFFFSHGLFVEHFFQKRLILEWYLFLNENETRQKNQPEEKRNTSKMFHRENGGTLGMVP